MLNLYVKTRSDFSCQHSYHKTKISIQINDWNIVFNYMIQSISRYNNKSIHIYIMCDITSEVRYNYIDL